MLFINAFLQIHTIIITTIITTKRSADYDKENVLTDWSTYLN